MPKLPLANFKGLNLKLGDMVQLKVASIGNGEVQFEYEAPQDRPASKEADYIEKAENEDIKQPEKPLTEKDNLETMPLKELRDRLPQKQDA